MFSIADIIRIRSRRRNASHRQPLLRVALIFSIVVSLLAITGSAAFMLAYASLTRDLPALQILPDLLDAQEGILFNPTTLYDRSGTHILITLENPAAEHREYLGLDQNQSNFLPPALISATLATTDPGFWQHAGYQSDWLNPVQEKTLAQRLASDLIIWQEPPGLRSTLRERLLAAQMTAAYGRQQVLIWYLNSANYGRLAIGADAASRVYFGKPAAQLSLLEACVLAAAAQAPALNPLDAPQAAREKSLEILQIMLDRGWIGASQAAQASLQALVFSAPATPPENLAPAFTNLALEQISARFDRSRLERGGYHILTSLDYDLQVQANCATQVQLARLQGQPETISDTCQAARLLPTLPPVGGVRPGGLGASLVVLNPQDGQILAMVGETTPGLDPAHLPGHPPGTLLTPFIYLTGFTRGLNPASLVWDIPDPIDSYQEPFAKYHGPMRVRMALANDYLIPAGQVLAQVGMENVWRTARQMGLLNAEMPSSPVMGDLLDTGQATLLEITQAYAVLANSGVQAGIAANPQNASQADSGLQATAYLRLAESSGRLVLQAGPARLKPVINTQLAYLVTHALSDEPARWPSLGHPNPLEIGRPAAAKVGRTGRSRHAWAMGYTPYLTIGVWIGQPEPGAAGTVNPSQAAGLWHAVMQYASRNLPQSGWEQPPGISTLPVCATSGLLPTAECPSIVNEIFPSGSEPSQSDNLYRKLQINRETGLLATVFTPPEMIDERIYLIFPPEAREWARQEGLPLPPENYDIITEKTGGSENAQIQTPGLFAYVRGEVIILGSAGGVDFAMYRLQVGKGLNPQSWLQIGEDIQAPVSNGRLGTWNTTGLNGLYALRLVIVRNNQRIETHTVQVTIDNQPPEISSVFPSPGMELAADTKSLLLRAGVLEDLAVKSVSFYIDGTLIAAPNIAPFTAAWQASRGRHTLKVVVMDRAGNSSETENTFTVK